MHGKYIPKRCSQDFFSKASPTKTNSPLQWITDCLPALMSFETDRNIYTKRKKRVTKEYSNIGSRK